MQYRSQSERKTSQSSRATTRRANAMEITIRQDWQRGEADGTTNLLQPRIREFWQSISKMDAQRHCSSGCEKQILQEGGDRRIPLTLEKRSSRNFFVVHAHSGRLSCQLGGWEDDCREATTSTTPRSGVRGPCGKPGRRPKDRQQGCSCTMPAVVMPEIYISAQPSQLPRSRVS